MAQQPCGDTIANKPVKCVVYFCHIVFFHNRAVSDQELISCLHDHPRSVTFTTGDSLFVYTQYDENKQHI